MTETPLLRFATALYGALDTGMIDCRALPSKTQVFIPITKLSGLQQFITRHRRANCYMGVATRKDATSGDLTNCALLPALYVDIDYKVTDEAKARATLAQFPFPPSLLVGSGGGVHGYWLLREPVDLAIEGPMAKDALKRLAQHLGGDLVAAECARILRLPGTWNWKYQPERAVVLDQCDPTLRYNLSELVDFLPALAPTSSRTPFTVPDVIKLTTRNATLFRLGRSLRAKGLSPAAIEATLRIENQTRCEEALDESEMVKLIQNVLTEADRPDFGTRNGRPAVDPDDPANDVEADVEAEILGETTGTPETSEPIPGPPPPLRLPPGFIQAYVETALRRTDAPAEAHILTAVTVLSALAGPQPRLDLAHRTGGVRLLVWSMNLVDSTSSRKTMVNTYGTEAIQAALGEAALLPWKGSPEAFIQLMAARDGQANVLSRDEYVGLLLGMKQGGYLAGLAQDFIRMWDGLPLTMGRTAKMNKSTGQRVSDSDVVRNPYLVQMTAATRSRFIEVATVDDMLDGFLARFTYTAGSAEEQRMKPRTPAIDAAWAQVLTQARTYHEQAQQIVTVHAGEEILDLEWGLEQRYKALALQQARPDVARPAMKRLAETVFKVAGLLALERASHGSVTILSTDWEAAEALAEPWQRATLALVADIGRTRFQADCDAVLTALYQAPQATLEERKLYRAHRRLKQKHFEEILAALGPDGQGLLRRFKLQTGKKGHQPKMVQATGRL